MVKPDPFQEVGTNPAGPFQGGWNEPLGDLMKHHFMKPLRTGCSAKPTAKGFRGNPDVEFEASSNS